MTKISAPWLTCEGSKSITSMLSEAGYEVYFVGGCVRNALVDMHVADLDLATNAHPHVVVELAEKAGLKAIPTGIDHGTVTVIADHRPYEITTYRTDVETDGRHAKVAFSTSLEEDAQRRDFTMNAIYCRPDGEIVDPVQGVADLSKRHVRFINDPDARIKEDYLRILRFFRFYAWFGDPEMGLDPEGLAACAANLDGLDSLAKERIQVEILKTLLASSPAPAMGSMAICGVLVRLLPGADVTPLAPLVHLEQRLGRRAHLHTRLAALNPGDVSTLLRLSKADTLEFSRIREGALSDKAASRLGYEIGGELAIEAMMLREVLTSRAVTPEDIAAARDANLKVFPVTSKDLMPAFKGKALGDRLRFLEEKWIDSVFDLSKEDLLALG